jgi:23S rRNA pseudouridine2604 synthase
MLATLTTAARRASLRPLQAAAPVANCLLSSVSTVRHFSDRRGPRASNGGGLNRGRDRSRADKDAPRFRSFAAEDGRERLDTVHGDPSTAMLTATDSGDGMVRLAKLMAQRGTDPSTYRCPRVRTRVRRLTDAFAHSSGLCSRREAEAYIQGGAVLVDGERVQGDWLKVPVVCDVQLAPMAQRHQRRKVTVVLNKPLGIVSAQPEDNHTPAVTLLTFDNEFRDPFFKGKGVRSPMAREEPVGLGKMAVCGRLDVNSTGLLLFTQDGTLAKRILDPSGGIEKEYLVRVNLPLEPLTSDVERMIEQLRAGVTASDGITYRAKSVEVLNANQLRVVLTEGKNRHIRRMCEHVGLRVMALKRVRIGELTLGKLPVGQWRYLLPSDRI